MKNLFCKRLAACLGLKRTPSPSLEPPIVYRNVCTADTGNCNNDHGDRHDHLTAPSTETTKLESIKKELREIRDHLENQVTKNLLKRVCDLLETRSHSKQEQRYEDDKENEMKNDWMLAAAVLDRICAIAIAVFFVVGVVVLFVLFAKHP